MPNAHEIDAPRMSSAATGARPRLRMSSNRSRPMPSMPSASPTILRRDSGSCSSKSENSTLQAGIVNARITLRPAGSCWTPNRRSPFQSGDVEERERRDLAPHRARNADRIAREPGDEEETGRRERQRERAKRERRHFGNAHLQHGPVAAPEQGDDGDRDERAGGDVRRTCGVGRRPRGGSFAGARAHRSLADGGAPYLLACSARACVTQASRRMRPGNSGSFASNSSMSRSLQRAIWR